MTLSLFPIKLRLIVVIFFLVFNGLIYQCQGNNTSLSISNITDDPSNITSEAQYLLEYAINASEYNPNKWTVLSEWYRIEGNYSGAESAILKGLDIFPTDPNLLNLYGLILLDEGDFSESIIQFEKVIQYKPYAAPFYLNLGTAYAREGNFSRSSIYFKKAVDLEPDYLTGLLNLGLSYLNIDEEDLALKNLFHAIEIQSNNPVPWINSGIALYELKQYSLAERTLSHGLNLSPDPADSLEAKKFLALINSTQSISLQENLEYKEKVDHLLSISGNSTSPEVIYPSLKIFELPTNDFYYREQILKIDGTIYYITLKIPIALYAAAKGSYKGTISNVPDDNVRQLSAGFYNSFIHEPNHLILIKDINYQLKLIKEFYPEYTFPEIALFFVRSLKTDFYATELRYPVESLYSGKADCDDRSVLLAALLSDEGFHTSLVQFPDHVIVGVVMEGPLFDDTGYVIMDPSNDLPIGSLEERYRDMEYEIIPVD